MRIPSALVPFRMPPRLVSPFYSPLSALKSLFSPPSTSLYPTHIPSNPLTKIAVASAASFLLLADPSRSHALAG
jgi:hypothetical protein